MQESGGFLGHNRLAIIDLSGGTQPFQRPDSPLRLAFNGEIYNFKQILNELKGLGHNFTTESDTEVLFYAWRQWGKQCVDHLRGMYAFAIWDCSSQDVYLARDPFGIKPIFYAVEDSTIFFASEMKSVLAILSGEVSWSLRSVSEYLTWQYVPGNKTVDQRIFKITPGDILHFKTGMSAPLVVHKASRKVSGVSSNFTEVMRDSIEAHTISDVGFGVLLSGGLDSTFVAKTLRDLEFDYKAYSLDFDDPAYSELPYIKHAVKVLGVPHFLHKVGVDDFKSTVRQLPYLLDEPLGDSSVIPTYLVSSFISQNHKVALSGDGGDEMFGGYKSYADSMSILYGKTRERLQLLKRRYRSGHGLPWKGSKSWAWDEHLDQRFMVSPEFTSYLTGEAFAKKLFRGGDVIISEMEDDLENYMIDDVLVKVDRMSMRNSLEVLVPFIDRNVYSYSRSLSLSELVGPQMRTKHILREDLLPRFGSDFVHRKKTGFGIPYGKWTREVYGDSLVELFSSSSIISQLPGKDELFKKAKLFVKGDDADTNFILVVLDNLLMGGRS